MDDISAWAHSVEERLTRLLGARIGKIGIIPGSVQQIHMAGDTVAVIFGKAADRPTAGSNACRAYFATDTNAFSCWNGTAWKATTLT